MQDTEKGLDKTQHTDWGGGMMQECCYITSCQTPKLYLPTNDCSIQSQLETGTQLNWRIKEGAEKVREKERETERENEWAMWDEMRRIPGKRNH